MQYVFVVFGILMALSGSALADARPTTSEYQLINLINHLRQSKRLPPLILDVKASQVAFEHSDEMREKNYFSLISPHRSSLEYQLSYARISGQALHSFVLVDRTSSDIFKQIKFNPALLSKDVTHAAIGLSSGNHSKLGKAYWATIILLEYMAQIDKIPRTAQLNEILHLEVQVAKGYQNPRIPVTVPHGRVFTYYPNRIQGKQVQFDIPLRQGRGRYTFELLLDKPGLGPRVASILPVYVGVGYPIKDPDEPAANPLTFSNTDQAAQYLAQRINQDRKKNGVRALTLDPLLNYVAWHHSADMAKRKFFAHVNPNGEDPNQRFWKSGGRGSVGENIAQDLTIEAAYQRLMNSPGHRANILQADYTHMGIGVYFDNKIYYITQMFQTKK